MAATPDTKSADTAWPAELARRWALGLELAEDAFDAPNSLEQYMSDAVAAPVPAVTVAAAPVAECVIAGDAIDTRRLPAPLFFDGDSHAVRSRTKAQYPIKNKQSIVIVFIFEV